MFVKPVREGTEHRTKRNNVEEDREWGYKGNKKTMASWRVFLCFLSVFCVSAFCQITHSQSHGSSICLPENHSALFIFGDSFFYSGNNNYLNSSTFDVQSNYEPYGKSFFKFSTGRFSDGRVIPDFIAEYAKLPLLPPYLYPAIFDDQYIYGVNFASAGSGALVETRQGIVIDLGTQASYFTQVSQQLKKKLGEEKAKALIYRAVFLFSVGGNDYASPFLVTNSTVVLPYPPQQFVDVVTGNITSVIKKIYEEGGRKFGFANVPPLSCFPILRRNGSSISACQQEETASLVRLHNNALPKKLQKLQKQLKELKYSVFDFYSALLEVMKYPPKYGFKEGNVACCGGGPYRGDFSCGGKRGIKEYELCEKVREYVFFDSAHPTETAAQHLSNLMWSETNDHFVGYNLKQLFEF